MLWWCVFVQGGGRSWVTDKWIVENVTSNIASAFDDDVAVILGKALLWACFQPSMVGVVPDDIRRNVIASFLHLNNRVRANGGAGIAIEDRNSNPIRKVEVIPNELGGQVTFDELFEPELDEQGAAAAAAGNGPFGGNSAMGMRRSHQQWMNVMYGKMHDLQKRMSNMENLLIKEFAVQKQRHKRLQAACNRAAMAPVAQRRVRPRLVNAGAADAAEVQQEEKAILQRSPGNLYVIWNEWESGFAGNKPAKNFTAAERNSKENKFVYCRRKPFWLCIERLIKNRAGTAHEAIRTVLDVYRQEKTVTQILKALAKHEREGGHVRLR